MGSLAWRYDHRERDYINEVLDSGFTCGTSGSMNTRLEQAFAGRMGRRFAIACANGTVSLHMALWSLGVGYGDEVIVTPLTVISCMNAILYCNAVPVFADVDPETFLIDPEDIRRKITPRTRAIMAVHLYGQVCDMTEIMKIAREYDLYVVEDCAQCVLGTHQGRIGGSIGHIGSWSFEHSKHLSIGDGGIVALDDEELADRVRRFSCQGFKTATARDGKIRIGRDIFQNPEFTRHDSFGWNYRLPEVAAAMGLGQVEKADWLVGLRRRSAEYYRAAIDGCSWLLPQRTPKGDVNSYYTFAVRLLRDDISWEDFRSRYIEFNGGGSVYAAWKLLYEEGSIADVRERVLGPIGLSGRFVTDRGICPAAERIQPQLMQFSTNQHREEEMKREADSLYRTIRYFS